MGILYEQSMIEQIIPLFDIEWHCHDFETVIASFTVVESSFYRDIIFCFQFGSVQYISFAM